MTSVADLRRDSHSGPDLYLAMDGDPISLGTLNYLLGEIYDAMRGVQMVMEELGKKRNADDDEPSLLLMAGLTIDYAIQCQTELIPEATTNGAQFWYDHDSDTGKRITFASPIDRAKKLHRQATAKTAKGE